MRHRAPILATVVYLASAKPALATQATQQVAAIQWGAEALSLVVAVVLLVYVFALAKVAEGSAIAENINLVVGATVCLAASVLANWAARFMIDRFSVEQAGLASQMLIIVAMTLFAIYIARVRRSLLRFLNVATETEQLLASAQSDPAPSPTEQVVEAPEEA